LSVQDYYVKDAPADQNVLDLFRGLWSSAMPRHSGLVSQPGPAALFEDERLNWADQQFGGFAGKTVLELGPLEGAHSFICQKKGATKVVSVEANTQSFIRCLCIKEIFGLDRVSFKLGDFNQYMRASPPHFDIVLACGVLYHMTDPIGTLKLISGISNNLFLWTHYYDAAVIEGGVHASLFEKAEIEKFGDYEIALHKKRYDSALDWKGFCGGVEPFARWLERPSLLLLLRALGFDSVTIGFDHPNHPNGPAFAVCAVRDCATIS
jgi:hypothetical protein